MGPCPSGARCVGGPVFGQCSDRSPPPGARPVHPGIWRGSPDVQTSHGCCNKRAHKPSPLVSQEGGAPSIAKKDVLHAFLCYGASHASPWSCRMVRSAMSTSYGPKASVYPCAVSGRCPSYTRCCAIALPVQVSLRARGRAWPDLGRTPKLSMFGPISVNFGPAFDEIGPNLLEIVRNLINFGQVRSLAEVGP